MFSKKKLLHLIERNLIEMPLDYGNNPERINPDIAAKLADKQHTYKDNPGIPQEKPEGLPSNFEELIASKRFIDTVQKVKHYTGFQGNVTDQNAFAQLSMAARQNMMDIMQFERTHKQELEQLAVELVKKELAIPEGSLQFDAQLVGIGEIDNSGFSQEEENPTDEEVEEQFGVDSEEAGEDIEQTINAFDKFNDEVAKRRLLNALIQGSAKKGHYMFELVNTRLEQMSTGIIRKYGVLMSINDLLYRIYPDDALMSAGQGGGFAGKEELDTETNPPTVKARGVFFPVLVHELIKGTMEVLATQGLPDDPKSAEMVMNKTDTLPAEMWDVRFGPVIWEKFIESYPDKLFEDDKKHLANYLISRFSALTTEEFFRLTKLIMKGDRLGKEIIARMVQDIEESLRNEDWEEEEYNMEYGDEDGDGDNLDDFLGSLGIGLPENE